MLNKHDLETSTSSPSDSPSAAMLVGKIFCFSASTLCIKWIIDSDATDHITPKLNCFSSYTSLTTDYFITTPNGRQAKIHHIGTIKLAPSLTLSNALHVPEFHYNFLSASRLAKQLAAHVVFTPNCLLSSGPFNEAGFDNW